MIEIEANDEWLVARAHMARHTMKSLGSHGASPGTTHREVEELQAA